jgi:cytochrome c
VNIITQSRALAIALGGSMVLAAATGTAQSCDIDAGAEVFDAKCATCHSIMTGQPGSLGPNLFGIVGRRPASVPGFSYSAALRARTELWTPAALDWYLIDPPARIPGTYMAFSGLKNDVARAVVICFLKAFGDAPETIKNVAEK